MGKGKQQALLKGTTTDLGTDLALVPFDCQLMRQPRPRGTLNLCG
jgi:hypothetical protein